ncbi:MAG: peptidoglycan DD-metalloendopeptidase family protein [Gammaproteobacteria bacterium]|nr:peptidoglycan DD-metalloendopeptidase family protein [Gammaproteobacteria bacterium]
MILISHFNSFILFSLLTASISFNAIADDKNRYQDKLKTIRENISQVENTLDNDKSQRGRLRHELKTLDKKISQLSKQIDYTNLLINRYKKSIKKLKNELKTLENSLNTHKQALGRQIKTAYMMGQHDTAKLLLNQQNAIEMGHAVIYYQYLNKTRSHQILEYNLLVDEKTRLKDNIVTKSGELSDLKKSQYRQKNRFSKNRLRRNKLIALLNNKIINNEETLTALRLNRHKIEDLLFSLGEVLADIPAEPNTAKPFAALKGRLPWPVAGRISNQFGSKKAKSDLKWNGVVLSLDYGKKVHAISRGRVIFSDWLQGYGFIIILDHGSSYMSLYGYNQNLLKDPGDWVNKGDVIATVGDSGGQLKSGLYFEIRKQGKPVNPKKWCSIKFTNYASR